MVGQNAKEIKDGQCLRQKGQTLMQFKVQAVKDFDKCFPLLTKKPLKRVVTGRMQSSNGRGLDSVWTFLKKTVYDPSPVCTFVTCHSQSRKLYCVYFMSCIVESENNLNWVGEKC